MAGTEEGGGSDEDWSDLIRWAQVHRFDGSREQMEVALGVAQGTVSKWVNRQRRPDRDRLEHYSEILEVPLDRATMAAQRTVLDREPPLKTRLAECEAERDRLRQEVDRLRAQLQDRQ